MSANLNREIGEVAEHVLLWRKENRVQLALLLGLSVKTINRRISGERPWEASEIKTMAEHFGIPVSAFYEGPDALFGKGEKPTTGRKVGASLSSHLAAA